MRRNIARATLLTLAVAAAACGVSHGVDAPALAPVPLPDLTGLHPAVQAQARERYDALQIAIDREVQAPALASAYGELGMLLQAAEFLDAAAPAYRNAQALAPGDVRWPYYLGHLYKDRGELDRAEAAFRRVLDAQPDDLATLVWLGRIQLDLGRPDTAGRLFSRASAVAPDATAVLAGLGRAALMAGRYADAIRQFERALALDPAAGSLHVPLAAAYRAVGAVEKAEPHLREWDNGDILVADPRYQELDMLLESGLAYELRGVRALEAGNFTSAAEYFRRGLELTPGNTPLGRSLGHKLATALYASGAEEDAVERLQEVVRAAPAAGIDEASGKAAYSLGVIMLSRGRPDAAIHSLQAAVTHQPAYVEARIALAESLRRNGRVEESLTHYEEALRLDPQAVQARWGGALALVRAGRHRQAAAWLDEAIVSHPDRPEFPHLLARVLSAAPDPAVRDGERALALVTGMLEGTKTTELGETLAMTLAELGDYDQAAAIQRGVLEVVRRGDRPGDVARLEANLRAYERGRPLRSVSMGDEGPATVR